MVTNSSLSCRLSGAWFLFKEAVRCLCQPPSKVTAIVAQIAAFVPPKGPGDKVDMSGNGVIVGPAPAVTVLMSQMNQNFLKTVMLPELGAVNGGDLAEMLQSLAEKSEAKPVVH